MLRGDMGQHEVASLERILICSARPVARHSQLPERVALPNTERLMWVPLLRCMLESLGLPDASLSPQQLFFFFGLCCARCDNSGSHGVMLK